MKFPQKFSSKISENQFKRFKNFPNEFLVSCGEEKLILNIEIQSKVWRSFLFALCYESPWNGSSISCEASCSRFCSSSILFRGSFESKIQLKSGNTCRKFPREREIEIGKVFAFCFQLSVFKSSFVASEIKNIFKAL